MLHNKIIIQYIVIINKYIYTQNHIYILIYLYINRHNIIFLHKLSQTRPGNGGDDIIIVTL